MKLLGDKNKEKEAIENEKEAKVLKNLRQNLVHKPKPIRKYDGLPKKESKVETLPKTPKFEMAVRAGKRKRA